MERGILKISMMVRRVTNKKNPRQDQFIFQFLLLIFILSIIYYMYSIYNAYNLKSNKVINIVVSEDYILDIPLRYKIEKKDEGIGLIDEKEDVMIDILFEKNFNESLNKQLSIVGTDEYEKYVVERK